MTEIRAPDETAPALSDPIAPVRAAIRAHYEILRQIGQGAFATVYLARDLKHERKVAIKILNADPTSETGELRFVREIRTVAGLQHPNILPLYDSGHVEALLYYVMPFVDGETLRDRIDRERQLPFDAACDIARETADALAYAHAQGIIHRDIKPENILMSAGHPMIADFGLARAIDLAGVKQLTQTGMGSPGTPAYMSPEQLLGDREIDGRSDLYSLACVLYEMLTGKPPFGGKEGFVKRFTEPPPNPSATRADLPTSIDGVIGRALAKNPKDRYPTAREFAMALTAAREAPSAPPLVAPIQNDVAPPDVQASHTRESSTLERLARPRPIALLAALLVIGIIAAIPALRPTRLRALFSRIAPDTNEFVVLPFAGLAGAAPHLGNRVADRVYDALTQWDGVPVVPDTKVAQAIAGAGGPPTTESDALTLAKQLGAGRLVWGQASGDSSGARVRVQLYDVRSGRSRDSFALLDSASDTRPYGSAALRLLGGRDRPVTAAGGDRRTHSFAAWQAYGLGHSALRNWDIPAAEKEFRSALSADPAYAPARLWLAQTLYWKSPAAQNPSEWTDEASRISAGLSSLDERDQLVAAGLGSLAAAKYPAACEAYTRLTSVDSSYFLGWYGLGECRTRDSVVVPRATSPSGWAFRSSNYSAARAYIRALKADPGAHAIISAAKLERMLPTASTKTRWGYAISDASLVFAAFPTLAGDTIAFIPYPLAVFATLPGPGSDAEAALRENAETLIAFAVDWAKRFPLSAPAQEALAGALETHGDLGYPDSRSSPVMKAVDSSLALSTDQRDILRLRAYQVRLHFKQGEFGAARLLADSILKSAPDDPVVADQLGWVAALTGRAELTWKLRFVTLSAQTVSGGSVPPAVAQAASRFFGYAAVGVCGPTLAAARDRLDLALRNYVARDIRQSLEADLATRSASLATPCTNGASALLIRSPTDRVQKAQQAFGRNDTKAARALVETIATSRQGLRPGDISPDYIFQEAWLSAALGDTVNAISQLDAELESLPTFSAAAIGDPANAASFGRSMLLRSDMAAKRGERDVARHWAVALDALWGSADPPLRAEVERIKAQARGAIQK
jgi:eukaryotic-like serine/threonine-protein kinase